MQIFVKTLNGETITLADASTSDTVGYVKHQIEEIEGIPVEVQRLIFEGKELEDVHELSYHKVYDGSTVHLSMDLVGGYVLPRSQVLLALKHLVHKKICRKCYCRLPPRATRCRKAKCGRTTDIRPKKTYFRDDFDRKHSKDCACGTEDPALCFFEQFYRLRI